MDILARTWHKRPLALHSHEVHIWRARLDTSSALRCRLEQTLSDDERRRAGRFYFQSDREHFIVARGVLRSILSSYLGVEAHELRFGYGAYGKPELMLPSDSADLRFNLSHAGALALYAVTRDRAIGIDLEYLRVDIECMQIAARFFSPREHAILCALPTAARLEAFFTCWTRKEAYIKARGEGLALPLDQFDVSLTPGEPAQLLGVRGDLDDPGRWSFQGLSPQPGYMAAVAVEGHAWHLMRWLWQDDRTFVQEDHLGDHVGTGA
jgi:4'-phosphopantetheinyl transferase